jgi:transposase
MDVVIGVDAHKKTHTLVAINKTGRKLGQKTIATTSAAHGEGVQWARTKFGTDLVWGVEDCRAVTSRLERDLLGEGLAVVRVPPHLMSRARACSRERGKSDPIDALAVARAVLREPNLPIASHDPVSMELRLLVDRREDLVGQRTAAINRLLGRVHHLDPGHRTPGNWKVKKAREEIQAWLATQDGLIAELARDEVRDIIGFSDDIARLGAQIGQRVRAVAPALLALPGCGELSAAKIVAEVAGVQRFRSEAAFARYAGLAPTPHSSGETNVRMRPSRHGNRQLNKAIHRIAVVQIQHKGPGRDYFHRRLAEGDDRRRALHALKRRLARVVFTRLHADHRDITGDPKEPGA